MRDGSYQTRIASVCPSPSHTDSYVGLGVRPPQYPTRVFTTPGSFANKASCACGGGGRGGESARARAGGVGGSVARAESRTGCQNQPSAKVAS